MKIGLRKRRAPLNATSPGAAAPSPGSGSQRRSSPRRSSPAARFSAPRSAPWPPCPRTGACRPSCSAARGRGEG
eukprot:scaffold41688_cov66-Phaeocystis_antarctica.AAC.1